ncbi:MULTISPECIES: rcc01693 family protein [Tritonibacter]|jgi:uncharacterized phage protein (TIGR02216 family)|uniref:Phage tail assembly chaperone n=1 Tax=Tritonibacter mobilis F1926 TaxID=1265309 RepID=A0A1B1A2B2_9RHOB|nr:MULTISPECIES: rcc01693 family protein [Tritonibacter]ANP40712.1 hypothetical protein K529_008050 [Tritonibacter mobilis F1926]KJZ24951.1 hypothetical protein TW79_04560 [Tritonibacter mobilis]MBU3035589.1 phage tail assembly chaperone [Tritonibacter mobilis]WHQ81172.1 phage tail assembly chaperone [Tritonibacter mobilis]
MSRAAMLDWPALMRAGMLGLRLTPREFWQLTPAELRLMLNLDASTPPMDRDRLSHLMTQFPDQTNDVNQPE